MHQDMTPSACDVTSVTRDTGGRAEKREMNIVWRSSEIRTVLSRSKKPSPQTVKSQSFFSYWRYCSSCFLSSQKENNSCFVPHLLQLSSCIHASSGVPATFPFPLFHRSRKAWDTVCQVCPPQQYSRQCAVREALTLDLRQLMGKKQQKCLRTGERRKERKGSINPWDMYVFVEIYWVHAFPSKLRDLHWLISHSKSISGK